MRTAPEHLHLALMLALWTGQRQGDLLRLPWSAYDGARIRLTQGKTGVRVMVPAGAPLRQALGAAMRRSPVILVNMDGKPWTPDGFRVSWAKACKKAGIEGVTFHDLRGTAVTRLAIAGATEAEIATITGHSLRDVKTILDSENGGVSLMKPMPALDALLTRAVKLGIFGTKMRSFFNLPAREGIAAVVTQQFDVVTQIAEHGLMPIIEPEISTRIFQIR